MLGAVHTGHSAAAACSVTAEAAVAVRGGLHTAAAPQAKNPLCKLCEENAWVCCRVLQTIASVGKPQSFATSSRLSSPLPREGAGAGWGFVLDLVGDCLAALQQVKPLFPMYTVPMATLLQMTEIKPHEELKSLGVLSVFDGSMGRAAFVSHQWVGQHHPDPDCRQFRVLQDALRNILSKQTAICPDVMTEILFGRWQAINAEELSHHDMYVWYDYFSCPQLESPGPCEKDQSQLTKAIESIPAYISTCSLLLVLCPVTESPYEVFGYSSWSSRGWCRLERMARECAGDASCVIIKSAMHVELAASSFASACECSPGEGAFTFEEDRFRIGSVVKQMLKARMHRHLQEGDLVSYRVVLNAQAIFFRGLREEPTGDLIPCEANERAECGQDAAAHFMFQNGFTRVRQYDEGGWSPLCYAALNGDATLVKSLLDWRSSPNERTKSPQPMLGLQHQVSVLGICAFFKHNDAMRVLIAARAEVHTQGASPPPLVLASFGNNADGIRLLCESRASPNVRNALGISALQHACAAGALDALDMLLSLANHTLDLSGSLHAAVLLQADSDQVVLKLLAAGADVNEQLRPRMFSMLWVFFSIKGMQYRFRQSTRLRTLGYHHYGATPLMVAILAGHFEAAATLIRAGSKLDVQNFRRKTAKDLLREVSAPTYLQHILAGQVEQVPSHRPSAKLRPSTMASRLYAAEMKGSEEDPYVSV